MKIDANIPVEELVENYPKSVSFLRDRNLVCVVCGEAVWGTLEALSKSKGFSKEDLDVIVEDLNNFLDLH